MVVLLSMFEVGGQYGKAANELSGNNNVTYISADILDRDPIDGLHGEHMHLTEGWRKAICEEVVLDNDDPEGICNPTDVEIVWNYVEKKYGRPDIVTGNPPCSVWSALSPKYNTYYNKVWCSSDQDDEIYIPDGDIEHPEKKGGTQKTTTAQREREKWAGIVLSMLLSEKKGASVIIENPESYKGLHTALSSPSHPETTEFMSHYDAYTKDDLEKEPYLLGKNTVYLRSGSAQAIQSSSLMDNCPPETETSRTCTPVVDLQDSSERSHTPYPVAKVLMKSMLKQHDITMKSRKNLEEITLTNWEISTKEVIHPFSNTTPSDVVLDIRGRTWCRDADGEITEENRSGRVARTPLMYHKCPCGDCTPSRRYVIYVRGLQEEHIAAKVCERCTVQDFAQYLPETGLLRSGKHVPDLLFNGRPVKSEWTLAECGFLQSGGDSSPRKRNLMLSVSPRKRKKTDNSKPKPLKRKCKTKKDKKNTTLTPKCLM